MADFSKLALATLMVLERRREEEGWGFTIGADTESCEIFLFLKDSDDPDYSVTDCSSVCEALERLAQTIAKPLAETESEHN